MAEQTGLAKAGPDQQMSGTYAIIYRPGPGWKHGRPLAEQNLGPHALYVKQMVDRGLIQAAGPLPTVEGGLVLLKARSLAAARDVMDRDPAIRSGQFVGFVSEWKPAFDPNGWFLQPGMTP